MLRTAIKGLLMAALVPFMASAANVTPTVAQGWMGAFDPSSASTSDELQVWLEGTGALAWNPGTPSEVFDQWGTPHTTTPCSVDSATRAGCTYTEYYTSSRPDQHGVDGAPDTSWVGATKRTIDTSGALATVTAATHAGGVGTVTYGDQVEITIPVTQYEEWVIGSYTDTPQTPEPYWGQDEDNPTNDPWTDYVITLEYVADIADEIGYDGWVIRHGEFTAYFKRALTSGLVNTTMITEISFFKTPDNGGAFNLANTLKSNWGSSLWWLPGYKSINSSIGGNNYWSACKRDTPDFFTACIKDAPEPFNTATGYIRSPDNVNAGAGSVVANSFGGFGELTFGAVPEPSQAMLFGASLICLASIRRRNS